VLQQGEELDEIEPGQLGGGDVLSVQRLLQSLVKPTSHITACLDAHTFEIPSIFNNFQNLACGVPRKPSSLAAAAREC